MATLPLSVRPRRLPDPRLLLGIVLVVASAAGVTAIVTGLDRSVVAYRAAVPLVAGDRVTAADLDAVPVRLGEAQGRYLTGRVPGGGLVVTRTVDAGELVPRSALGSAASLTTATVVVDLSSRLSDGVSAGAVVDLWSAPLKEGATNRYGAPVVLVSDATIRRVVPATGIVTSAQRSTVEVEVPRTAVAEVLQAVADGARLSAVSVTRPVSR